jgi:RecG-like helicase
MNDFLLTPIEYLKGVGPQRASLLKQELAIFCFEDLLNHFPFRYVDRSYFCKISEIPYQENAQPLYAIRLFSVQNLRIQL